eukprot:366114-Chlamydomonas_euryale.AAC.6
MSRDFESEDNFVNFGADARGGCPLTSCWPRNAARSAGPHTFFLPRRASGRLANHCLHSTALAQLCPHAQARRPTRAAEEGAWTREPLALPIAPEVSMARH